MTEDEAKTKWCPFVRIHNGHEIEATNRDRFVSDQGVNCIGSACMAWRWDRTTWQLHQEKTGLVVKPASEPHGYCGLAGQP